MQPMNAANLNRSSEQLSLGPYRDQPGTRGSNPDLQDYYDDASIPPPHRLSGLYTPSPIHSTEHLARNAPSARSTPLPAATDAPYSYMPASDYTNMDTGGYSQSSRWLEQQQKRNRRSKWIVIGSILGVIGLVVIGVAVGVTVSKNKKNSSSNNDDTSSGAVNQTDPNDPSTFVKDSRLIQSFYGLAYTPEGSQYPACGNSQADVITDIQLMSQLTTRIRLYGADCNQSALVLEAIQQTKVNMTVYLAIYNIPTDSTPYTRQKTAIVDAINTYGTSNIGGVTVGNEWLLDYLGANNGGTDPNGPVGEQGAALLNVNITDMRNTLDSMNLSDMPVGTSDAGSYFNNDVLNNIDYGMANVHPWFANQSIQNAAGWTANFFQTTDIAAAANTTKNPEMYIAETGWPTESSDAGNANNGASDASEANLQIFLDTFVCAANTNGTKYFFFEYFNEPWKDQEFGGVEGWWGLFASNRTLKNINIPNCTLT